MSEDTLKIGIVTAEESGDLLAAEFIKALSLSSKKVQICGLVGEKLGHMINESPTEVDRSVFNVMGLIDPFLNLQKILGERKKLLDYFLKQNIDIFIGVDSPDLNLYFHKNLKNKQDVMNIQLVSPSVWGWRPKRINLLKKYVDLTLCLFKFEHQFLQQNAVNSLHLGHPFSKIRQKNDQKNIIHSHNLPIDKTFVSVLVGSRDSEIRYMLDTYIMSIKEINKNFQNNFYLFPTSNERHEELINQFLLSNNINGIAKSGASSDFLQLSEISIVTSGTATLEAVCNDSIPIICYKTGTINYFILSKLVISKYIGIPNLILNKDVFPELIQNDFNHKSVSSHFKKITLDKNTYKSKLFDVKELIKGMGFAKVTADVLRLYENKRGSR